MKLNRCYCCVISGAIIIAGCVKTSTPPGTSSLTIVNAMNGSSFLLTDFTPLNGKGIPVDQLEYYINAAEIYYSNALEEARGGETSISLYNYPDTSRSFFAGTFDLGVGKAYSLFICGDTLNTDTLFTKDSIPYYPYSGDSVVGVRFVNLAQNSMQISVNIQGDSLRTNGFSNLYYRDLSSFKSYPATSSIPGYYIFEIRNQSTDSILSTYTWYYDLFKSQTIVIAGSEDPASNFPINVWQYNNF